MSTNSDLLNSSNADKEVIIRSSIENSINKGIELVHSTWGVEWSKTKKCWLPTKDKKCCALACVILENQDKLSRKIDWRGWTIEAILDVDVEWVRRFNFGFDGFEDERDDFPFYLGRILRKEFIG